MERYSCLEFILQNSKHGEGGLIEIYSWLRIFRDTLVSKHVFGNKNCWPLNFSLYYISCLDCLSRYRSYMIALLVVVFSRPWTRWSRSTSNFYALIGQNLTGFMQKIYVASWRLFTVTAEADRVLCQLVMFLLSFSIGRTKWNSAAIKSLLLFMASLFIGFLVEKYVACQSRKSDFGWHRFVFVFHLAWLKSLKRFELHLEW